MALGALMALFDYSTLQQDEFNDWYDTEHLPQRMAVPGFLTGQRWLGLDNPELSLAIYDLSDLAVLQGAEYSAVARENSTPWTKRITAKAKSRHRFEAEQLPPGDVPSPADAGGLLMVAVNVTPDGEQEVNRWYDEEHIPMLRQAPGVLSARRFRVTAGDRRYVSLYHLESPAAVESAAWKEAVATPWRARVQAHLRDRIRLLCRPYRRG